VINQEPCNGGQQYCLVRSSNFLRNQLLKIGGPPKQDRLCFVFKKLDAPFISWSTLAKTIFFD
jgi:hypothetical protein